MNFGLNIGFQSKYLKSKQTNRKDRWFQNVWSVRINVFHFELENVFVKHYAPTICFLLNMNWPKLPRFGVVFVRFNVVTYTRPNQYVYSI